MLYDCPNPIYTLTQYSKVTDEYLIFDSTVLDGKIENQHGTLQLTKGSLLLVPSLDEKSRNIISQHFYEVGAKQLDGITNTDID